MGIESISKRMRRMVRSIAFYPAVIAFFCIVLSYLMIQLDYSELGREIKTHWGWLKLRDASTARTIISVIAAGILSLAVFSFTMVMVVLNQAASQMSNRVLDKLIGNRFQQIVLGIYIGTIVYALFLLSAIRDIDQGIYVPSLSTYLLILLAVSNIFMFIYFLHHITQSVKYSIIIKKIREETAAELRKACFLSSEPVISDPQDGHTIHSNKAGVYSGFDKNSLIDLAEDLNGVISILLSKGSFVIKGMPLMTFSTDKALNKEEIDEKVLSHIYIEEQAEIKGNYYNGFRQLTEIAIKALSPGINDPGTAVESLRSIAELLSYRLSHHPTNVLKDRDGNIRVVTIEKRYEDILKETLLPIWDYGRNDRFVQQEIQYLVKLLQAKEYNDFSAALLQQVEFQMASKMNFYG